MKRALWSIGVLFACLAAPSTLRAQAPVREEGLFIALQPPISRDVVNRVKAATEACARGQGSAHSQDRLRFQPRWASEHVHGLRRLSRSCRLFVETPHHQDHCFRAWRSDRPCGASGPGLPGNRHVARRAIGRCFAGRKEPLEEDQIRFYENVAHGRRPTAVILKMIDPAVSLVEAARMEGGGAKTFIDARRRTEEQKRGILATNKEPIVPAGAIGLYDTILAQQLGLCDLSVESRNALVEAYSLTPNSLRGDPLEGRDPIAERVVINEPFTRALQETLERRMRQAIGRRGVNAFVLRLESSSGDTLAARDFAEFLRKLKEDEGGTSLLTIAYVPDRAPGALAIVAMGCTDIAMGPAPNSAISSLFCNSAAAAIRANVSTCSKNPWSGWLTIKAIPNWRFAACSIRT